MAAVRRDDKRKEEKEKEEEEKMSLPPNRTGSEKLPVLKTTIRWPELQQMTDELQHNLTYLAGEAEHFARNWIAAVWGPAAVEDVERQYDGYVQDWLPAPKTSEEQRRRTNFEGAYRSVETGLQMFAVAIDQAEKDNKPTKGLTFSTISRAIHVVLRPVHQHMRALCIPSNSDTVTADVMPDDRRHPRRRDTKIIRYDLVNIDLSAGWMII